MDIIQINRPALKFDITEIDEAQTPSDIDRADFWGFSFIGASDQVNEQYYRFTLETLEDLAKQYALGEPLMLAHQTFTSLPVGKSVDAIVQSGQLEMTAYILLNQTYSNAPVASANDLVRLIRSDTLTDVSLGVSSNNITCSICGSQMDSYSCTQGHIRGTQEIVERDGQRTIEWVIGEIQQARANEVSLVYSGADDNAKIIAKGIQLQSNGMMSDKALEHIQLQFGSNNPNNKEGNMSATQKELQLEKDVAEIRLEKTNLEVERDALKKQVVELQSKINTLEDEAKSVELWKNDIQLARKEAIDEYIQQYTAATGVTDEKALNLQRDSMKLQPLAIIEASTLTFKTQADAKVNAGGERVTSDTDDKHQSEEDVRKAQMGNY